MTEGRSPGKQLVTIPEAARILQTTEGAIRKRLQRGSLHSEKGKDGRVYVRVETGQARHDTGSTNVTHNVELVSELRERIESLERTLEAEREANRENRRIIMQQAQNLSALEAPESPPERHTQAPHNASDTSQDVHPSTEEPSASRGPVARLVRWVRGE